MNEAKTISPDFLKRYQREIKSITLIKNSVQATQLQHNIDCNLPSITWYSSLIEDYSLQNIWSTEFSNLYMIQMFPECVCEMNTVSAVISLLKLLFNHKVISIMLLFENIPLLNDIGIYKYLQKYGENDWERLKEYFNEHIFQNFDNKEKCLFQEVHDKTNFKERNLVLNCLYNYIALA